MLLGKGKQLKQPPPPLFTPVLPAETFPDGQNKPLIQFAQNGFEAKATNHSQKPVNPFSKAAKGTQSDTMIVILGFDEGHRSCKKATLVERFDLIFIYCTVLWSVSTSREGFITGYCFASGQIGVTRTVF